MLTKAGSVFFITFQVYVWAAFGYYVSLFCEGGKGKGGFCPGAFVRGLSSGGRAYILHPHAALYSSLICQFPII